LGDMKKLNIKSIKALEDISRKGKNSVQKVARILRTEGSAL